MTWKMTDIHPHWTGSKSEMNEWHELFSFQLHKRRVRFLLCRLYWAHTFFSSESSMQALLRWEGAREMWSGPRSRCCWTAAFVFLLMLHRTLLSLLLLGSGSDVAGSKEGCRHYELTRKRHPYFGLRKKKIKGKSGEGFNSRVLTQLKNVPVWARASKFGKSGHSEGNDVGKAQGMCRKRGQICRDASEGSGNPAKGQEHARQSKFRFGWGNNVMCPFWDTGRKTSRS